MRGLLAVTVCYESECHNLIRDRFSSCSEIVEKKVKDVREALRKFRDQMLEQIQKGVTNPQLCL